ncbi:Histidine phosphatase superfamily protein [Abortiporus biennis]
MKEQRDSRSPEPSGSFPSSRPNSSHSPHTNSLLPNHKSTIHGVVVLARNGDRTQYVQDPLTYKSGPTLSTPLGEVQAHQVGSFLRKTYLDESSSSHIHGISTDLVNLKEVHVRVKVGGEGASVFDSATATLQGLFPPNPANRMTLANETTVVAPLGGYQYVPVETVEPFNDRSLEPWTDCPAFKKHVQDVLASEEFKAVDKKAQPFFNSLKDFVFGRTTSLANAYNLYEYVSSELIHNKTYAHRLPPTFLEQARGLADYRENAIFSDGNINGIGHLPSRAALSSIVKALQRIAFNDDPLQLMLIETTYQPFISFFHQTEVVKKHPELKAIPDFGSVLAIELRRAPPPDVREFLRFRFRNGTDGPFETITVFDHHEDIPLTEFIYRVEASTINSNSEWARACSADYSLGNGNSWFNWATTIDESGRNSVNSRFLDATIGFAIVFFLMLFALLFKQYKKRNTHVRLQGQEEFRVDTRFVTYGGTQDEKLYYPNEYQQSRA